MEEVVYSREISAVVKDTSKIQKVNKSWFKKLLGFIWTGLKSIFQLVCADANKTVIYIVNSPENQELAKQAVEAAISAGLKGEEAWDAAMQKLDAGVIKISETYCVEGSALRNNIKDALLQLVYTMLKSKIALLAL